MFDHNPVARYAFDLDDVQEIAVALDRAAAGLADAHDSTRAAVPALADLPGVGPDAAAVAGAVAARLTGIGRGLRTDARWLAGVLTALARDDAAVWTAKSVRGAVTYAHNERMLRRQLARTGRTQWRGRKVSRAAAAAVDLFGADIAGSALPKTAVQYYRTATRIGGIDRALWQVRYPVAWYSAAAAQAVHAAAATATGAARRLLAARDGQLSKAAAATRRGLAAASARGAEWAVRIAGDGRGLGRLRRIGISLIPGTAIPALYFDGREMVTQRHGYGPRGALEALRDSTAVSSDVLHLGGQALEFIPVAGDVAALGVDAVASGMDLGVMAMDGVDYVVFAKGKTITHAVGSVAGDAVHAGGSLLHKVGDLL